MIKPSALQKYICCGYEALALAEPIFVVGKNPKKETATKWPGPPSFQKLNIMHYPAFILLTSSKNQIYEFRIPNIYNYFFNNIGLMYTLCFLVASVKLKVYKKVVKFSFKQQKILGIRNS